MIFKNEKDRIYALDDNGKLIAEITFPQISDNTVEINHTFVDESLRGKGVAGELMERACKALRERGLRIKPTCSYAVRWLSKNVQYDDIIDKQ